LPQAVARLPAPGTKTAMSRYHHNPTGLSAVLPEWLLEPKTRKQVGSWQNCPGAILCGFWPGSRACIANPAGAGESWLAGQRAGSTREHGRPGHDPSAGAGGGRSPGRAQADGSELGSFRVFEAQLRQGARRFLPLRCQPISHPRTLDGLAGGDEQTLALDGQRPALGDAQAGHRGSAQLRAGHRRSREPDRNTEHRGEGNSPGQLADPGAGIRASGGTRRVNYHRKA